MYKMVGLVSSLLSAMLAGMIFKQVWKRAMGQQDAPEPTDEERSWREVLPAAAAQGALVGLVKALISRGEAAGIRRVTGSWPS